MKDSATERAIIIGTSGHDSRDGTCGERKDRDCYFEREVTERTVVFRVHDGLVVGDECQVVVVGRVVADLAGSRSGS